VRHRDGYSIRRFLAGLVFLFHLPALASRRAGLFSVAPSALRSRQLEAICDYLTFSRNKGSSLQRRDDYKVSKIHRSFDCAVAYAPTALRMTRGGGVYFLQRLWRTIGSKII
jgi:hypothetical protein